MFFPRKRKKIIWHKGSLLQRIKLHLTAGFLWQVSLSGGFIYKEWNDQLTMEILLVLRANSRGGLLKNVKDTRRLLAWMVDDRSNWEVLCVVGHVLDQHMDLQKRPSTKEISDVLNHHLGILVLDSLELVVEEIKVDSIWQSEQKGN
jgi:hypothetical protein